MYHNEGVSLCSKQQRIIIIGTSCSGKTTLAQQVSQQLAIKHVELDELHWLPGWQEREPAVFRQMVTDVVSGDSWVVVCGQTLFLITCFAACLCFAAVAPVGCRYAVQHNITGFRQHTQYLGQ